MKKETIVIGVEFGQNATKATVLHRLPSGTVTEYSYLQPTLAVPLPSQADEGEPLQTITFGEQTYLTGESALLASPDAIYQTYARKVEEPRRSVIRLCFMAVLAWANTVAPIHQKEFIVVTSHPDSEWADEKDELRALLTGAFQFSVAAPVGLAGGGTGRLFSFEIPEERVKVVRESIAPWYAQVMEPAGQYKLPNESPLLSLPGGAMPRTLVLGLGFRDGNMAKLAGKQRTDSTSWIKGVEEIYKELFNALRRKPIRANLRSLAEVEQILRDPYHPVFPHRGPEAVQAVIREVVMEKGAALLAEAFTWAGDPERYHMILAAGGGCRLLEPLVREHFAAADEAGRLLFAEQGDGARGLAYLGMYAVRQSE